jgi:hypothetical protein
VARVFSSKLEGLQSEVLPDRLLAFSQQSPLGEGNSRASPGEV